MSLTNCSANRNWLSFFLPAPTVWRGATRTRRVELGGIRGCFCSGSLCFFYGRKLGARAPQPSPAEMPPQLSGGLRYSAKVVQGTLDSLPQAVREFVESNAKLCWPDQIHICDGSEDENRQLLGRMEEEGVIKRLRKYDNW